MNRCAARFFLLIFPSFLGVPAWTQTSPRVEEAAARPAKSTPPVAPSPQKLFGTLPIATNSAEARSFIEGAWDKYENAMYDAAVAQARHATEKDPQSALGYAMISFAARRLVPDAAALAKAKALLPGATPDEQLLVRWMTSIQDRDLLPAIINMNDLLKRFSRDKHVLYVTGEWLFLQQDYDRARAMLETALQLDPNFPAALNRLGYLYVRNGDPDPVRALASLKKYAAAEPGSPNPEDSLGEVSRIAGDDRGSLQHYTAALRIDPAYLASQIGLGDTRTLMGDFEGARREYERAIPMAGNARDELYVKYQRALAFFWEGKPAEGHKALADLAGEAAGKKEPNSLVDIGFARAMLAEDFHSQLEQLRALATFLEQPLAGMSEADRGVARAAVWRERARVTAFNGLPDDAAQAISQLEELAASSRDLVIENAYESARGYVLFAEGDFVNAADELATDIADPLVVRQYIRAQEKLGNAAAADTGRKRLKYLRAPTVPWFLVTHPGTSESD